MISIKPGLLRDDTPNGHVTPSSRHKDWGWMIYSHRWSTSLLLVFTEVLQGIHLLVGVNS